MDNTTQISQQVSIYKRLGEEAVIRPMVKDILDQNTRNPVTAHHFKNVDMEMLKQGVFEFFPLVPAVPILIPEVICEQHIKT